MLEEQGFRGRWWVEGKEDEHVVYGTANFDPEGGITLDVTPLLEPDPTLKNPGRIVQFDRILGVTEDGTSITCVGCTRDSASNSNAVYRVKYLFEGSWFYHHNPAFDYLKVSFPRLEDWAELTTPTIPEASLESLKPESPDELPRIEPGDVLGVEVNMPESPVARVEDKEITLSIHFDINYSKFRSGTIDLNARFKIDPRRPQVPFNELFGDVQRLRNFITFGTSQSVSPRWMMGYLSPPQSNSDTEVNVFYSQRRSFTNSSRMHPQSMTFRRPDLDQGFHETINRWWEINEQYDTVIDLYFGTQYNPEMYTQNAFLSLMQAIESFHRQAYDDEYMAEEDYDDVQDAFENLVDGNAAAVMAALMNEVVTGDVSTMMETYGIGNDFRNKLFSEFEHLNEASLRKRLREIVNDHEDVLEELPHNVVDKQHPIIETRNHLTHRDDDPDSVDWNAVAQDVEEQIELVWGLEQLIEVCLLTELGIPDDQIQNRLFNRYKDMQVL